MATARFVLQLLMKGCAERGAKRIRVHILLDGRDVAPGSAPKYIDILEKEFVDIRNMGCDACIASGGGRMAVTMDRYEVSVWTSSQLSIFSKPILMLILTFINIRLTCTELRY